jgi:hypothetical protein
MVALAAVTSGMTLPMTKVHHCHMMLVTTQCEQAVVLVHNLADVDICRRLSGPHSQNHCAGIELCKLKAMRSAVFTWLVTKLLFYALTPGLDG